MKICKNQVIETQNKCKSFGLKNMRFIFHDISGAKMLVISSLLIPAHTL